jgi:CheY-like chemotaxis protein
MHEKDCSIQTILLADDDADDREFFQDALGIVAGDIDLKTVENGAGLLQLLLEEGIRPDIIFLDLNMPVKNGRETLYDIRQNEQVKDIPVVICSTSLHREAASELYDAGANLYIVKPNGFVPLMDILKRVITLDWKNFQRPSKQDFILQP